VGASADEAPKSEQTCYQMTFSATCICREVVTVASIAPARTVQSVALIAR